MDKREKRLHQAKKIWELFLDGRSSEQISNKLSIPPSEVMCILNYTSPEFYNIDLSSTLLVKLEHQQEEINKLKNSLDASYNRGWVPISIAIFIASCAVIISLVIVSV